MARELGLEADDGDGDGDGDGVGGNDDDDDDENDAENDGESGGESGGENGGENDGGGRSPPPPGVFLLHARVVGVRRACGDGQGGGEVRGAHAAGL